MKAHSSYKYPTCKNLSLEMAERSSFKIQVSCCRVKTLMKGPLIPSDCSNVDAGDSVFVEW